MQSLSQNSLSGAVASSCLLTASANDTCRVAKQGKTECFGNQTSDPRCVLWALFRWSEIKKRQWSLKPDGTHGDGSSGKQAVDEAEEDVLGVLRVALDAQHVLADAEHLDGRLVGGGQHLRALRHLPHLLAMTKNAISRLQRCTWECRRYTTRTLLVLVDLGGGPR